MFHIILTDCAGTKLDERIVSRADLVQRAVQSIAATMNFGDGDTLRIVYQEELGEKDATVSQ